MESEQEKLMAEFAEERKAEARAIAKAKEQERAAKLAEKKRLAKIAEEKRLAKIEDEKAKLEEMRAAEREAAEHEKRMAEAAARGRKRALEKMERQEAERKAEEKGYEQELEEGKRVKALFARKEEQERKEREAVEELRLQKLMREKREEMVAKYSAMEEVTVTNDGEKKESVMVTPSAPLITVSGEAGMTHSYPLRTFKPEEPKTTETVTLKANSETMGAADHTMFACVSLAVMGSIALATVSKSRMRSPMAAPEAGVELLTKSGGYVDLEDQEPIVAPTEPSWASSEIGRAHV